ncbi:MAG: hypothetical protein QOG20_2068 [Pseudonocardiales bacterium]|nr:hypothetical protein [Pseudonocardiales bacterium]
MNDHHYRPVLAAEQLGAAAASAAAAGWPVFPVRPRGKIPAVVDWETVASTDPDQIAAWWQTTPWNIGISTGRAGLLVIDLDPHRGAPPPAPWTGVRSGRDVLARLAAAVGEPFPADTCTVATPSGGRHLYFRQPSGVQLRNTQGALGWRIDTGGHGGYVLAAGSRAADGRRYRVLRDLPVAELPPWLLDALSESTRPTDVGTAARRPTSSDDRLQAWSAARLWAYLRAVVDGERHAVATAEVGHRHTTLLKAARRLGHSVGGAMDEAVARAVLTDAASGYVGVGGYTSRQVERDITDGLAYGARQPRFIDDLPPKAPGR